MKPLGIRHRILFAALAPAVLVAVFVTALLVVEQLDLARADQHHRLSVLTRQIGVSTEYSLFVGDSANLKKILDSVLDEPDVIGAAILAPDGQVLAQTDGVGELPRSDHHFGDFRASQLSEEIEHWHRFTISSRSLLELDLFTLSHSPEAPPLGELLLKISNKSLHDNAHQQILNATVLSLVMLALAVALALGLSRGLIRTLTNIRNVVDDITQNRPYRHVAHLGGDELGVLARGIYTMADTVSQTQEDLSLRVMEATAELRRERDAAEEASLARSRFFAAASHDLRQPVQALGLFAARLEHEARDTDLSRTTQQISKSINSLRGLIDTLLDYSRIDGQVLRSDLCSLCAYDFLRAIHAEFKPMATEKGLDLRLHARDALLMTDRALLYRILINLVSNAIRYTTHGGVLIGLRCGASHARIEVWDTGPGIPAAQRNAIFEELVQLENPERDANKGFGLGLAIVRRLADLLKHPIQLKSRVGHGSCFSITVPLAQATSSVAEVADETAAHGAESGFLLIGEPLDDVTALLQRWGFPHEHVASFADASPTLIATSPSVIICSTQGDIASALTQLDQLDAACGQGLPALLIHPGPHPAVNTGSPRRPILARPFQPARLRALINFLQNPDN